MDVLSTAIDLGITITAAVEQISPNGSESATISGDIVNSLLQIEKYLKQQTLGAPEVLRDDLNHFKRELRRILRHQERLIKRASNGQIPEARGKLKQVYNADDIKDRLVELHQKVQKCYQNLQMSRITRKDGKLTTGNLQKDAMQDEHAPRLGSNVEPTDTLQGRQREANLDEALQDELDSTHSIQDPESTISIKGSLWRSLSSLIVKIFHVGHIRKLRRRLSKLWQRAFSMTWSNSFRKLESVTSFDPNRDDFIQESRQILKLLKSRRRILDIDIAKDLLCISRALREFEMHEQAEEIRNWGVRICCELAADSSQTPLDLAEFLQNHTLEQASVDPLEYSQEVLGRAVKLRRQLREQGQNAQPGRGGRLKRNGLLGWRRRINRRITD